MRLPPGALPPNAPHAPALPIDLFTSQDRDGIKRLFDAVHQTRYGFSVADINSVVQAAIGGQEVTRVYEGEMNFALTVRFAPEYRRNIDAIRSIPVALPSNDSKGPTAYIALGELGDVKLETGAAYIYRENNQRFVPLKYSVRGRDLGSTVAEAQKVIADRVPLPPGYRIEWTGEFGALVEAQKRLAVIVPLSLLLIMMLLYSLFNSIRDSLLALAGIPFAVAGGILGLYVAGLNFSISAAIGFISLFGVSSMDGILLVSYIRKNMVEGLDRDEAIILAGETRMRQIFMTGLSACIGLVPAALSTGIGAQVQQPRQRVECQAKGLPTVGLRQRVGGVHTPQVHQAPPEHVEATRPCQRGRCRQQRAGIPVDDVPIGEMLKAEPLLNPRITRCLRVPDASADSFLASEANAESARSYGAQILNYHEVV